MSNRCRRSIVGLLVVALAAVSCTARVDSDLGASEAGAENLANAEDSPQPEAPVETTVPQPDAVDALLASMSTEQKVGQLLMPLVQGQGATSVTEDEAANNLLGFGYETPAEIVAAYQLGGVIYLENNISSSEQLSGLSDGLQTAAANSSGIGLLISVDQEGGRVNRVRDEVTVFPSADELGQDADRVREAGFVTGQQVKQQGINVVLAPVADVRTIEGAFIAERSFGSDPATVASMVVASIEGLQQAGVAATIKHWPGHGGTTKDSHNELPEIDVARSDWANNEAVPFVAAIEADVAIVMVGHLSFPQIDESGLPAIISPTLIDGLLRDELAFDGVVMTDALDMGAVDGIPQDELVVNSILAGADIMLMSSQPKLAYNGLIQAVEDGRISQERLDASVTRVLRLKHDLGLLAAPS